MNDTKTGDIDVNNYRVVAGAKLRVATSVKSNHSKLTYTKRRTYIIIQTSNR